MSDSARYNAELAVNSMPTGDLRDAVREIDDSVPSANARSRHKQRTRRDVYQAELDRRLSDSSTAADVPEEFVDRSPINEDGDVCSPVVFNLRLQMVRYRCRADRRLEALRAWKLALKTDKAAPQPMPSGLSMFVLPAEYDSVVCS